MQAQSQNAHKSYIRGIFIKLGAGVKIWVSYKRSRQQQIDTLLSDIKTIKTQNKANLNPFLSSKLLSLRTDLRNLLLEFHERAIRRMKITYYFSGNKVGKLLATTHKAKL